eukprot:1190938-Prorocentrum_minimum.AAC.4
MNSIATQCNGIAVPKRTCVVRQSSRPLAVVRSPSDKSIRKGTSLSNPHNVVGLTSRKTDVLSKSSPDVLAPARFAAVLGTCIGMGALDCDSALAASAALVDHSAMASALSGLLVLGEIDPSTAAKLAIGLRPILSLGSVLMIVRIVMSWFPEVKDKEMPWALAYYPTEPLLGPLRKIITPVNGVDISPIVSFGVISFFSEILLGPQGLLILMSQKIG